LAQLSEINWAAVQSTDFRDAKIKEGKQAEFLLYDLFPWKLIEKIGTHNGTIAKRVKADLDNDGHQPIVSVERTWYF